jgi:hypothetical protein
MNNPSVAAEWKVKVTAAHQADSETDFRVSCYRDSGKQAEPQVLKTLSSFSRAIPKRGATCISNRRELPS